MADSLWLTFEWFTRLLSRVFYNLWFADQGVLRFEQTSELISRVHDEMTHQISHQIRQRLAKVVHDLKNAVGQQAAKDYLTGISSEKSIEIELEAKLRDHLWMKFINNEYITDSSSSSYPTPSFSCEQIEELLLQKANSHTDADSSLPTSLPHTACLKTSARNITEEKCFKHPQVSTTNSKREFYNDDTLKAFVENIPCRNLLDCLAIHWEVMKTEEFFERPSSLILTWTLKGNSTQIRRLHHYLVLRYLNMKHDLYQWRRSIAELRNLNGYTSFLVEAQAKQRICTKKRSREEINSNKAHQEYLAHIYADRTPRNYQRIKRAFKKNLRHGRRWSILINNFLADDGNVIPRLGSEFLLLCETTAASKM